MVLLLRSLPCVRVDLVLGTSAFRSLAVVRMRADVPFVFGKYSANTALEPEGRQRTTIAPINASIVRPTVARIRMITFLRTFERDVALSVLALTTSLLVVVTLKGKEFYVHIIDDPLTSSFVNIPYRLIRITSKYIQELI